MIIEHTSVKYQTRTQNIEHRERKEGRAFEGKKIVNQVAFNSLTQKQAKSKVETPAHRELLESDTFRELLSRRDRHKESESKMEHRFTRKIIDDNKSDKNPNPHNKSYSKSKSKSRSKGIVKSKSLKQLGKKSKSMVRLQVKQRKQHHFQKITKEQRKSESPNRQLKSTMSFVEKKNYKSNYVSKTNREYTSELTTDRDKSKGKLKTSQISKPSKKGRKPQEPKKKTASNIITEKKKTIQKEKQNSKKVKPTLPKPKKQKKVIISQQSSKFKRNEYEQWQNSLNDDQFLHPKQKKQHKDKKVKHKDSNIVEIPKRKERLSLNTTNKRHFQEKNAKTEAEVQGERERMKDLEQLAAVTIQKVFRGYLTRKYIRECFEHNAAINIQRMWRGYRVRRDRQQNRLLQLKISTEVQSHKDEQQQRKILQQEQYLLQKSSPQESLKSSRSYNQKWALLQQIFSDESVSQKIKQKIHLLLQKRGKQSNQFDYRSNRSSNQISSEKHFMQNFIELEKKKKQYPHMNVFISPTNYKSPKRFGYNSPQSYLMNSPNMFIREKLDQSWQLTSHEMIVENLKSIQKFNKERLHSRAENDKKELNNMLMKNKLSPRTHEKKYKDIDQHLVNELSKFNESINEIVTYILEKESPSQSCEVQAKGKKSPEKFGDFDEENMITPKKELVQLQLPYEMPEQCINSQKLNEGDAVIANFRKLEEKSQQFCEYYKFHKQELKQQPCLESFDTSYQFIEEYLINLIDYLRQYENGAYVSRILAFLKKPRSHLPQTIISNMKIVTQNSEEIPNDNQEDSFRLPMYKYFDLDEQIIDNEIIYAFNQSFSKLKKNELGVRNELEECFIKMIAECMNQALNSLRPTAYLFTETQLRTINTLKAMDKVPVFENDNNSEEEQQYQFMFAQTLSKIFYWNKLEWGKAIIPKPEDGEQADEMKEFLQQQEDECLAKLSAKEDWSFCEQLVELIGLLTQELFDIMVCEEIAQIWTAIFEWNNKITARQSPINLRVPDCRNFFQV